MVTSYGGKGGEEIVFVVLARNSNGVGDFGRDIKRIGDFVSFGLIGDFEGFGVFLVENTIVICCLMFADIGFGV